MTGAAQRRPHPPLISVLMPAHNALDTLAGALGSILHQTVKDWELVLVDDGSDDGTGALADEMATQDDRIRVVHTPHRGIVEALNHAASLARGPLLARMDADDVSLPGRFAAQLALFDTEPGLVLCGGVVRMVGGGIGSGRRRYEGWINGLLTHEDMVREIFVECPLPHPTFMMRRDAFLGGGGYTDNGWPEDYDLVMRLWRAGGRFAKPAEPLLDWREHPRRLSMTDDRYGETAFRALKRHYLFGSGMMANRLFLQWGAGEVGKRWLREWGAAVPAAVVDINPRKIGRTIHGVPVIPPEQLPRPEEVFIVVAVGSPGARDEIRDWFGPRGYTEGRDFLFLA